jgi:hypothetical protein
VALAEPVPALEALPDEVEVSPPDEAVELLLLPAAVEVELDVSACIEEPEDARSAFDVEVTLRELEAPLDAVPVELPLLEIEATIPELPQAATSSATPSPEEVVRADSRVRHRNRSIAAGTLRA